MTAGSSDADRGRDRRAAGRAPGWSRGASRSRARRWRASPIRRTGDGRCRASATRRRAYDPRAGARPRTAATAPAGCSPAIAPATSCSRRSIGRGFANQPTSVSDDDGLRLTGAFIAAVNRCAPPANKPTPQERDTCLPYLEREIEALGELRVIVALGVVRVGRCAAGARRARPHRAAEAAVRSRRRGGRGSVHAGRLLPPEPAEHVHRQAHAADARRRVQPISGPGDGSGRSGAGDSDAAGGRSRA